MTRRSFDTALAKGEIGEKIVQSLMERKGWVVYRPETEGAHHFDMLCIKDKRHAVAFDVKAKARMNKWPATGVNQRHFEEYQRFSEKHKMPFWIVFVDEFQREIYGNTISELERPRTIGSVDYPWVLPSRTPIRLWPLAAMKSISPLDGAMARKLMELNQRGYEYEVNA